MIKTKGCGSMQCRNMGSLERKDISKWGVIPIHDPKASQMAMCSATGGLHDLRS